MSSTFVLLLSSRCCLILLVVHHSWGFVQQKTNFELRQVLLKPIYQLELIAILSALEMLVIGQVLLLHLIPMRVAFPPLICLSQLYCFSSFHQFLSQVYGFCPPSNLFVFHFVSYLSLFWGWYSQSIAFEWIAALQTLIGSFLPFCALDHWSFSWGQYHYRWWL